MKTESVFAMCMHEGIETTMLSEAVFRGTTDGFLVRNSAENQKRSNRHLKWALSLYAKNMAYVLGNDIKRRNQKTIFQVHNVLIVLDDN